MVLVLEMLVAVRREVRKGMPVVELVEARRGRLVVEERLGGGARYLFPFLFLFQVWFILVKLDGSAWKRGLEVRNIFVVLVIRKTSIVTIIILMSSCQQPVEKEETEKEQTFSG